MSTHRKRSSRPTTSLDAAAKSPQHGKNRLRLYALGPVLEPGALTVALPAQLGKRESCAVRIASPYVSRQHAELRSDDEGRAYLVHLARTNTTSLNGCKLALGDEVPLHPHDILMLDIETFQIHDTPETHDGRE